MSRPIAFHIEPRRIPSVAGLVVGLTLSLAVIVSAKSAAADDHKFVGARKCKTCHKKTPIGNQYGWWLDSKHAEAYETLASDQAKEWGAEAGVDDPQTDEKCIQCHSTAHGVPDEMVSSKFDRKAGVQCEACHGAGKDYRKKKIMVDPELSAEKGLIPQSAEVCVRCHNDESPAWDPARYTLEDSSQTGFDYDAAVEKILHPVPEGYDPLAEGEAD
jgi:hypothetical protein